MPFSKVHAETCLLIRCSSLGRLVFLSMVLRNFLRGCSNHENIGKKRTSDGVQPNLELYVQYLAEPIAAALKTDVDMHCNKTPRKNHKKTTTYQRVLWSEATALIFGLTSVSLT